MCVCVCVCVCLYVHVCCYMNERKKNGELQSKKTGGCN
jgi:hypothetical protein